MHWPLAGKSGALLTASGIHLPRTVLLILLVDNPTDAATPQREGEGARYSLTHYRFSTPIFEYISGSYSAVHSSNLDLSVCLQKVAEAAAVLQFILLTLLAIERAVSV